MSYRVAAERHDVKRSTLKDFISGGKKVKKLGRKPLFTSSEEHEIAVVVDEVVQWGFPLGNLEVRMLAKDLANKKKVKLRTQSGLPGEDWYHGFVCGFVDSYHGLVSWARIMDSYLGFISWFRTLACFQTFVS